MQQASLPTESKDSPYKLLLLAFPLILANITTPLLGLVDTAILGHMDETYYLAGASIATLILTQLYWICGFLKMSVTGLSAQTKAESNQQKLKVLVQGVFIGLLLGIVFVLLQEPVLKAGLFFAQSSENLAQSTREYFAVRVWGAPAALANLAFVGWFIGQQKTKQVLLLQVAVNLINILFSLCFVFVLDWGIAGVAAATVVAEYSLLILSMIVARRVLTRQSSYSNSNLADPNSIKSNPIKNNASATQAFATNIDYTQIKHWIKLKALAPLLSLNSHILFRNLALQFTLAFVTFTGARLGAETAATNAILMQFFALIALGLDGVANAVEALVGEHKGSKNVDKLKREVNFGLLWSSVFALVYAVVFWLFGENIIGLLTNQENLQVAANGYLSLMIALPLIAHWCFLMDGVFVGLTHGKAMRDSMIASAAIGFFGAWWFLSGLQNLGLWLALLSFLACRGIILGVWYVYLLKEPSTRLLL